MPEADPREEIRVIPRPFKMEVPRPRESVRDLNSEICSTNADCDPIESVKVQPKLLV